MNKPSLLPVVVHAIRLEARNVVSVELRALDGEDLLPFQAGAHIDLHLSNGMVRSYSVFNSPSETHRYLVGVLNDRGSRGGSRFVHTQLRVGSTLNISAPRNNFELDETASKSVLVAGGIGVTPIFCMYNRLRDIGKPVELIYCARNRKEAAFEAELAASDGKVRLLFDEDTGGAPRLRELLGSQDPETHFYCCGPAPMLDAFETSCKELGYRNVHVERFGRADAAATSQGSGYEVQLERSGRTLAVPAGSSLLDVLLDAGFQPDYSCREGVCGACETTVLAGVPDHRDALLTEQERETGRTMMICVSGCKGDRLVLDM